MSRFQIDFINALTDLRKAQAAYEEAAAILTVAEQNEAIDAYRAEMKAAGIPSVI